MQGRPDILVVDGVSVTLGRRLVLRDVAFALRPGEFCGLIGANGSGKTTLLRTVLGLRKPDSGRVVIAGGRGLGSVGYVPQKSLLDATIPVRARDLVMLGLDGHRLGLPLPSAKRAASVRAMLDAVGAGDFADRSCSCSTSPSPIWTSGARRRSSRSSGVSRTNTASRSCCRRTT
jgi:zinc/manganese transport system ATP-binding protein